MNACESDLMNDVSRQTVLLKIFSYIQYDVAKSISRWTDEQKDNAPYLNHI